VTPDPLGDQALPLPDERELIGGWVTDGGRVKADDVCRRIEHLTTKALVRVAVSKDFEPWETLFRDPRDGRLWERTFPQGHLQGGGPPRLAFITPEVATTKYGPLPS
jgi:hypothetical protein